MMKMILASATLGLVGLVVGCGAAEPTGNESTDPNAPNMSEDTSKTEDAVQVSCGATPCNCANYHTAADCQPPGTRSCSQYQSACQWSGILKVCRCLVY
jgi:hypothetical protein